MALTIEDGTGVAGADSFQSLVDARALAASYGVSLPTDDAQAEVDLRLGYRGLIVNEPQLQGARTHDAQTGIFPRTGVTANCVEVEDNSIPDSIKLAQIYQSAAIGGGMEVNAVSDGQKLSGINVQGVYSETYQDGGSSSVNSRVQGVYNELYPYTGVGYRNSPCGKGSGFGQGLGRESFGIPGI